ncbi:ExeA family protein [Megalodesulfovibrio paquesii]
MYTTHFGLKNLPFENSPDPDFFFNHGRHAEVLDLMKDFLAAHRGLLVVAGPIGTGKTTLSQMLVRKLPEHIKLIWLVEPPSTARDFVLFVAHELGIPFSHEKRLFIIRDLVNRLVELRAQGKRTLIIVDEAHLMTPEVLEGVRIMNNFEQGADKLVHMLLIGQDELLATLEAPAMRPLRQRISTIINLGQMTPPMVRAYVEHRLELAGGSKDLFTPLALDTVAHVSSGAPRLVNTLCNIALRNAFIRRATTVDYEEVFRAAEELGLGTEALHHLINVSGAEQLEALKEVDLEAWASRIRAEVALEVRQSGAPSSAENASGPAPATSAKDQPKERAPAAGKPTARTRIAVPARPAASPQVESASRSSGHRRGWLTPLFLLAASLATLLASLHFYGPQLGLDVHSMLLRLRQMIEQLLS